MDERFGLAVLPAAPRHHPKKGECLRASPPRRTSR